jgi:hypothetical protein
VSGSELAAVRVEAEEAAARFLAERYPGLGVAHVQTLRFGQGSLVQVTVGGTGQSGPARLLLMVNGRGTVEELGPAGAPRPRSTAVLDSLRRVNEVIDLR